jgi:hypothetical protein
VTPSPLRTAVVATAETPPAATPATVPATTVPPTRQSPVPAWMGLSAGIFAIVLLTRKRG